jgi:hypothetical protein
MNAILDLFTSDRSPKLYRQLPGPCKAGAVVGHTTSVIREHAFPSKAAYYPSSVSTWLQSPGQ